MDNQYSNASVIAAEALSSMQDNLVVANLISRDRTSEFTRTSNGYKVGETVAITTYPDYTVKEFTSGTPIIKQAIRNSTRSMKIEKLLDVSVEITAREKKMNFQGFSEQVIQPAAKVLAAQVEILLAGKIADGAGLYTSATLFSTAADIALARKEANYQQLGSNRICLVNDTLEASLLGQEWFNQSQTRGTDGTSTLASGVMGNVMGMNFVSTLNFPTISRTGGTGVNITKASPTSFENLLGDRVLVLNAADAGTYQDGDRIKVAGMRRPLIVSGSQATPTSINLVDPITEIVPASASVTCISSGNTYTGQGAIFDSRSLALIMPMLDRPSDKPSAVISDNGFSIRVVTGYDIDIKAEVMSLDLLIGTACYDPRAITVLADF